MAALNPFPLRDKRSGPQSRGMFGFSGFTLEVCVLEKAISIRVVTFPYAPRWQVISV